MAATLIRSVLFVAFTALASASGPTKIYINQVPAYYSLATCAEPQLSTIVRGMMSGCGDGSRTTSFVCFCFYSSARFSSLIESQVASACPGDPSQSTKALEVFSDYCKLGEVAAVPTDVSITSAASPSAAPLPPATPSPSLSRATSTSAIPSPGTASISTPPTSTPTSEPSSSPNATPKKSPPTAAIAAGIAIPIVVISLAIACFFYYRRRTLVKKGSVELPVGDRSLNTNAAPVVVYELKEDHRVEIAESEIVQRFELDSPRK